jgi:ribosome-associated translation inhibitor RaiA
MEPVGTAVALGEEGRLSHAADQGAHMTEGVRAIQISGTKRDEVLRARVAKLMKVAVSRVTVRPVRSQAVFFDDNGPKGGRAMRCALTVRLPYRPSIRVERSAVTTRLAFDAAFPILERQLERYCERDRENKRRPKKYFAASRVLAGESARPARRTRRA